MARSFKSIVESMLSYLKQSRPTVDTKEGSFTRDVIIDPSASEFDILYSAIDFVSNSQSPDLAYGDSLDRLARNFQILRKPPIPAIGTITFFKYNSPATPISIPKGTAVSTKGSTSTSAQQYVTIQDTTLTSSDYNTATSRYETNAPIRAVLAGTAANAPEGTITVLVTAIGGVAGCTNSAAVSTGTDRETDLQLSARLKQVIKGNNVGTISGYYALAMSNTSVSDARVVGTDDTVITKRAGIGVVDIIIRGTTLTDSVEIYNYNGAGASYYYALKQPMYYDSGSFSVVGSISGELMQGTDYTVTFDTSVYGGSTKGRDRFNILSAAAGESLIFTYSYNSLIEDIQRMVDSPSGKIVGTDVLVRAAKRRLINLTATVEVLPGYTSSEVSTNVNTAVANALSTYLIGQEVQQSDLVVVMANVDGVDDVLIPLTTLKEDSSTGDIEQDSNGNLIIPGGSYAYPGSISILTK